MAEAHYGLGACPSPPDDRDYPFSAERIRAPEALPPSVDLRGGTKPARLKPVGTPFDQGQFGTCVANSTAMMLQALRRRWGFRYTLRSRAFIYYEGRKSEGDVSADNGMYPRDALQTLVDMGCPTEKDEPYATSPLFYRLAPSMRQVADATHAKLGSYHRLQNDAEIMATLAACCPVPIVVDATHWGSVPTSGIIPDETLADRQYNHAPCLVGYDANYWIVLNSWSSGWANAGFAYIPTGAGDLLATGIVEEAWAGAL